MKKITKSLFILTVFVCLITLTGCINFGCRHKYILIEKVDAVDCKTPGYADYECEKCGKHKHERLIIQHDVENKDDYISIQYCKNCGQDTRLNPVGSIDEDFYYCYKDSMMDDFDKAIDDCYETLNSATDELSESKKKSLANEVNILWGKVIEKLYVIKDQYTASDVNFYVENNDTTTENKDLMEKKYNECSEKYRYLYYDCFHSPLKEYLFEGEDLEKIEKQIQNYKNPKIKELEDKISEEEHDLYFGKDGKKLSNDEFSKGYASLLKMRDELAKLYNYDNFYEYSHNDVFGRVYDIDQVIKFRENVCKYIPQLNSKYFNLYYNATESRSAYTGLLSICDSKMFNNIASTKYYVNFLKFMTTDKLDFYREVNSAFKEGRVFISTKDGVEAGFTTSILEDSKNIMYFYNGEYYSCPTTVVHETGHFMFKDYYDYNDYDLFEVHSQTNEFMFALYLNNNNLVNTEALIPYQLFAAYNTILNVSAIDEFEYSIYINYSDLREQYKDGIEYTEYDLLYSDICNKYHLDEVSYEQWHYYTTQSSCYAISYAISLIPTICKYYDGVNDFDSAKVDYIKLLTFWRDKENKGKILTFNEALEYCSFANPFEEETFALLK